MLGRYFAEGLLPSSKRPRASANLVDKGDPMAGYGVFVVDPAHEDFPRLGVVGFPPIVSSRPVRSQKLIRY